MCPTNFPRCWSAPPAAELPPGSAAFLCRRKAKWTVVLSTTYAGELSDGISQGRYDPKTFDLMQWAFDTAWEETGICLGRQQRICAALRSRMAVEDHGWQSVTASAIPNVSKSWR